MADKKKNPDPPQNRKKDPEQSTSHAGAGTRPKRPAGSGSPNQPYSVIMFALAILFSLLAAVQGSALWFSLHQAVKGIFGLSSLLVPVILCYLAVKMEHGGTPKEMAHRCIYALLATAFLSTFFEIMFGGGRLRDQTLGTALKMLYNEGIAWESSGAVSILAYPLMLMFGDAGSKILICLLLFVAVMLLTRKSLTDLGNMLLAPFRRLSELFSEERKEERILERYEQEQDETQRQSDREALYIAELSQPAAQEPQFSIDVPMENVPDTAGLSPLSGDDLTAVLPAQPADPGQDEALEELIRKATEKPKKKTKEEQKLEAVLEIADEVAQQAEAVSKGIAYQMPRIDFLNRSTSFANDPNAARELREKHDRLKKVLADFKVNVNITNIARGPSVTRYEVLPEDGVKVSRITSLSDDIALHLAAEHVRIEAPIPGKAAIGIEVPNVKRDTVSLRELLESKEFTESKSRLAFAVGKDITGNCIIGDIAKMPHMLIAGATGSGKSVCTNSIIMSLLYHAAPSEVKLILVDPKIVEFRVYDGIPHLLIPVVTDPKKAAGALNWAVQEMQKRYEVFAENGVRNLADFNTLCRNRPELELKKMPQIVICIDELADLMMTASKEVEDAICRLAQLARAAGMHLIIATQRPTTDIITGLIKANIPSRLALSVMSPIDSRIILDTGGAEKLLGNGDMLYLPNGQPKPVRVQGCFVSTEEIERVVSFIKAQSTTEYDEDVLAALDEMAPESDDKKAAGDDSPDNEDGMLDKAIEVVVSAGQASTSNLQRRLHLGYARAARIMDELEEMGIIGPYEGAKPRRVLMTKMQLDERRLRKQK